MLLAIRKYRRIFQKVTMILDGLEKMLTLDVSDREKIYEALKTFLLSDEISDVDKKKAQNLLPT